MKTTAYFLLLINIGFYLSGCASMICGTRQEVSLSSMPSGATVVINDSSYGKTPMLMDMKRKIKHRQVKLMMDGYETFQIEMTRQFNGWVMGNLFFGGLIGMGVDALTGAWYNI